MARVSRSKQNKSGKPSSTKNSSNNSSSNKSSNNKSSNNKKNNNRRGSLSGPGRNNPNRNKSPGTSPTKTNTKTNTSPSNNNKSPSNNKKGTKTGKKTRRERAQEQARKRIDAGISVSDAVSMNKKSMRDNAKKRHAAFKESGFQTKGGRFAKDDKGRVYDARKKANQDRARERHQRYTQARKEAAVDRKSARLAAATGIPSGADLPAGSFGISKAGREQAAANRMAARQTMNLDSGLNIGSKAKFKDGQKVATNYNDLPSGLQNILQNQLKSFEKQGQGDKELQRLKNMYPGFMPRADAGVFGTIASTINPVSQLGNLVTGAPVSAAQFSSDTGEGEGAAGTPESGGLSIGQRIVDSINPLTRALQIGDFFTDNRFDLDRRGDDVSFSDVKSLSQALGGPMNAARAAADFTFNRNLQINPSDVVKNISSMSTEDKNRFGDALNALQDSRAVQNVGVNRFNLPSDFQDQIGESVRGIVDRTKEAYTDTRGRVDPINQTMKELGTAPDLAFASKLLKQYEDGNTNFVGNVRQALQPNAQRAPGFSLAERGPFRGSAANAVLGGMASDIFRDARDSEFANKLTISGNNLADASDVINFGTNVYNRMQQPGTVAATQAANIGNIIRESGGTVTGPGILRGVTGIGTKRGGSNRPPVAGANQPAPTMVPEEILEFLEPTIPSTDTSEISLPEFVDPTDAYDNALNEFLYNPNYFPQVQQYQKPPVKTFAQTFNRDYF